MGRVFSFRWTFDAQGIQWISYSCRGGETPAQVSKLFFDHSVDEIVSSNLQYDGIAKNKKLRAGTVLRFAAPEQLARCSTCRGALPIDSLLICDGPSGNAPCGRAFHIACLNPPLAAVPDDSPFRCPACAPAAAAERDNVAEDGAVMEGAAAEGAVAEGAVADSTVMEGAPAEAGIERDREDVAAEATAEDQAAAQAEMEAEAAEAAEEAEEVEEAAAQEPDGGGDCGDVVKIEEDEFVELLHQDKPSTTAVANDPNRHATIIVPSFKLAIPNQHAPSSLLWYVFARASPDLVGRFALLGKGQDEVCSKAQLQRLLGDIPHFLKLPGGPPFSLFMIAHGRPGTVFIGKSEAIPLLDLVQLIIDCLPTAMRPLLRHVHIDACETLQGVTEADMRRRPGIQHISLSGFNVSVPVAPAQWLGQRFMVALSEVLQEQKAPVAKFNALLQRAKARLQEQPDMQNPHRAGHAGQEMTVSQLLAALTII